MLILYCDLCGQVITNQKYLLYIDEFVSSKEEITTEDYKQLENSKYDDKVICPQCKKLIDLIFEKRLDNMIKVAKECKDIIAWEGKNHVKRT